jgi:ubiquinone/menaquinone biosynthesis C-methylase UbiE
MTAPATTPRPAGFDPDAYRRARAAEGRLLDDALVAGLPSLPSGHPLALESALRRQTAARFLAWLAGTPAPRTVLDVGCGTGWLAAAVARIPGTRAIGIDLDGPELDQARRVFGQPGGAAYIAGVAETFDAAALAPDVIVLASVIQYLADPAEVVGRLLAACRPGGSVHVLDSPLYRSDEVAAAAARTAAHYARIAVPELAAAYHHHTLEAFAGLAPVVVRARPAAWRQRVAARLGRPISPFPWLRFDRPG